MTAKPQLATNGKLAVYREAERVLAEPAPYLCPLEDCPICGACPGLLYWHDEGCAWMVAYRAAGLRMRHGLGPPLSRSGYTTMTVEERLAVRDLDPKLPPRWSDGEKRSSWLVRIWRALLDMLSLSCVVR